MDCVNKNTKWAIFELMSELSKLMCGIIVITIPTIQFGGSFLLQVLSGHAIGSGFNPFQKAMFRAGHAHAGVLVILSLLAQLLLDHAQLSESWSLFARIGIPLSALMISGGFFGAAVGKDVQKPGKLIGWVYAGSALLALSLIVLGVGLLR